MPSKYRAHSTWTPEQAKHYAKLAGLRSGLVRAENAAKLRSVLAAAEPASSGLLTDPVATLERRIARASMAGATPQSLLVLCSCLAKLKQSGAGPTRGKRRSGSRSVSAQVPVTQAVPMDEPE